MVCNRLSVFPQGILRDPFFLCTAAGSGAVSFPIHLFPEWQADEKSGCQNELMMENRTVPAVPAIAAGQAVSHDIRTGRGAQSPRNSAASSYGGRHNEALRSYSVPRPPPRTKPVRNCPQAQKKKGTDTRKPNKATAVIST